jgi:hypothetical protein
VPTAGSARTPTVPTATPRLLTPEQAARGGPPGPSGRVYAVYPADGLAAVATRGRGLMLIEVPPWADLRIGDGLEVADPPAMGMAKVAHVRSGAQLLVWVQAVGLTADRLPRPGP